MLAYKRDRASNPIQTNGIFYIDTYNKLYILIGSHVTIYNQNAIAFGGSVVECLTRLTALWSLSKTHLS